MFWTPKWKKHAKLVLSGSNKFINFKKDLLQKDKLAEIHTAQQSLRESIKEADKSEVKKKSNLLEKACRASLSSYKRPNVIAENTESIFGTLIILLAIQAFFLKTSIIPTNSMQPTLNGINSTVINYDDWPNPVVRLLQKVTHGRNYIKVNSKIDDEVTGLRQYKTMRFFTKTQIMFSNQPTVTVSGSARAVAGLNQHTRGILEANTDLHTFSTPIPVKANETIFEGVVDAGDMVIINKAAYNFRKPTRGEVFVFNTRNIEEINRKATGREINEKGELEVIFKDQLGAAMYIKRCIGVPGDEISLDGTGGLLINGAISQDKGIERAMQLTGFGRPDGYKGYTLADPRAAIYYSNPITSPKNKIILKGEDEMQFAEYAAFGDNTENSSDSRYWGSVKEYNLEGPALLTLWPFRHEALQHWGLIK